jgi:hypothetical protein
MGDGPLVSVILPVCNGEAYVLDAIGSVLSQTYEHLELLVVNDGSTDRTGELVDGVPDPRVVHIRRPNGGLAAARNTGLGAASGPLVAFLDHDDLWTSCKLERQVAVARPGVIVYSDFMVWDTTARTCHFGFAHWDRFPERTDKFSGRILPELLAQNFVHPSSVLAFRSDLEAAGGFREELRVCEDWDLWLRCAERYTFCRIEEPLVVIRRRSGSLQSDRRAMRRTAKRVLRDAERRLVASGPLPPGLRAGLGLGHFASRNMSSAACHLGRAILARPWRAAYWRWLGASLIWPAYDAARRLVCRRVRG